MLEGASDDLIELACDITQWSSSVADLLVRRLDDNVKARLKQRAKLHGRSVEAEARAILEEAVGGTAGPDTVSKVGFGTLMQRRFGKIGLTKEEARLLNEAIEELRRGSKPRDPGFDS